MNSLLLTASNVPLAFSKINKLSSKADSDCYTTNASSSMLKVKKKNTRTFCCQTNAKQYRSLSFPELKPAEKREDSKALSDCTFHVNGYESPIHSKNGIGILEFLAGKNYFITGGTGLLGKALIEKILRASPELGKIYVLVRAESKEDALEILKKHFIESELFDCVRRMHGKSYQAFMLSKLVPVPGNVGESNLGMDPGLTNEIAQEVDVIINSAANTSFEERLDVAVNINTRGPSRVLDFAKECSKLCAFLHISTAFVHRERKAIVNSGESLKRDKANSKASPPLHSNLDVDAEMKLALDSSLAFHGYGEITQKMKEMGLERARSHGFRNVYEFTKAMGEIIVDENRGEIPIVIMRPSVIESTYKEPYPGWIQGNRMVDPLILSYGKGYLPVAFGHPEGIADVIPLDMVVNAIIAAMAKHGRAARKPSLTITHVVSSGVNPLVLDQIFNFSHQYFNSFPHINTKGKKVNITQTKFIGSMEDFSLSISEAIAKQIGLMDANVLDCRVSQRLERICEKVVEHTLRLANVYGPYMFSTESRFEFNDTEELLEAMSEEEKLSFGFDIKCLDWKDFFMNIHIPGLRKYVLKGRGMIDN